MSETACDLWGRRVYLFKNIIIFFHFLKSFVFGDTKFCATMRQCFKLNITLCFIPRRSNKSFPTSTIYKITLLSERELGNVFLYSLLNIRFYFVLSWQFKVSRAAFTLHPGAEDQKGEQFPTGAKQKGARMPWSPWQSTFHPWGSSVSNAIFKTFGRHQQGMNLFELCFKSLFIYFFTFVWFSFQELIWPFCLN